MSDENKKEGLVDKAKAAVGLGAKPDDKAPAAPAQPAAADTKKDESKDDAKNEKKGDGLLRGSIKVTNTSKGIIGLNGLGGNDQVPPIMLEKGKSHTFESPKEYAPYADSCSTHLLRKRIEMGGVEMSAKHKIMEKNEASRAKKDAAAKEKADAEVKAEEAKTAKRKEAAKKASDAAKAKREADAKGNDKE